jgi:hypothetical protein
MPVHGAQHNSNASKDNTRSTTRDRPSPNHVANHHEGKTATPGSDGPPAGCQWEEWHTSLEGARAICLSNVNLRAFSGGHLHEGPVRNVPLEL